MSKRQRIDVDDDDDGGEEGSFSDDDNADVGEVGEGTGDEGGDDGEEKEKSGDGDEVADKKGDEDPFIPIGVSPVTSGKAFRFRGKQIGLTYVNGDITVDDIKQHLSKLSNGNPLKCFIAGRELAPSTNAVHYHVYVSYANKLDVRGGRRMDVGGCHPNVVKISKGRRNRQNWIEYCLKGGDTVTWPQDHRTILFRNSQNFIRDSADHNQWLVWVQSIGRASPFPWKLPNGEEQHQPTAAEKKCGHLILGAASSGKTRWWMEEFAGKLVYPVHNKDTIGRYDNYQQQPIVIFNDVIPTRSELFMLGEYHGGFNLFLTARYHNRPLPKERVVCIICCNRDYMPDYAKPENDESGAFASRFEVFDMDEHNKQISESQQSLVINVE